jgi:hypothetical protein
LGHGFENQELRMASTRTMVYGAVVTIFSLFGGLLLGVIVGNIIFELTPGHQFQPLDPIQIVLPSLVALAGFFAGGAAWGVLMGRLARATDRRRMAIAGALGFAPITLALALLLQVIEPIALEQFGAVIPLHRLFTLLFVPTAFLIAGVSAWAIGIGLRDQTLAQSLGWRIGLASAITFWVINLAMESAGWIVGAPRAAERFTMLMVMFVGDLGAAIVGGALMARMITKQSRAIDPRPQRT